MLGSFCCALAHAFALCCPIPNFSMRMKGMRKDMKRNANGGEKCRKHLHWWMMLMLYSNWNSTHNPSNDEYLCYGTGWDRRVRSEHVLTIILKRVLGSIISTCPEHQSSCSRNVVYQENFAVSDKRRLWGRGIIENNGHWAQLVKF